MEIACIVEGDGEQQALPVLVRRIVQMLFPDLWVHVSVSTNFRGRDKFQDRVAVQAAVDLAARRVGSGGAVLIVRDADDDCPVEEAQRLRTWAMASRSDVQVSVVIARREYEAWFLANAESLRDFRGVRADLDPPARPESIADAKGWLTRNMARGQPYSPTRHQASFSDRINIDVVRSRSPRSTSCVGTFSGWSRRSTARKPEPRPTFSGVSGARRGRRPTTTTPGRPAMLIAGRRRTRGAETYGR